MMHIIPQLLDKKIVPLVLISFLVFLTLSTSVMGAAKIAGSINEDKTENSQDEVLEESKTEQEYSIDENSKDDNSNKTTKLIKNSTGSAKSSSKNTAISGSTTGKVANNPTSGNKVLGIQSTPSTSTNSDPNACIITVFGQQYDVTSLRSSHPGGDVFVCGADQSSAYQSAHGTNVSRLAKYLVTSTSTTGGGSTSSGSGTSGSQNSTNMGQQGSSNIGKDVSYDDKNEDEHEDQDDNENDSEDGRDD